MSEYWLTIQVDPQRTRDIRVSGEDYAEVAKKYKQKNGFKVIAVRPCDRPEESND